MENLPKKLVVLRKYHKLSQKEVADRLSMSEADYIEMENGQEEPKASQLLALSECYGVTLDLLLKADLKTVILPLRLKELRENNSVSVDEVVTGTGIKKSTINHYEAGTRIPKLDALIQLAHFFQVSIDYLVGLDFQEA